MRRSPAAEHLAAPPVARQQLRTAHNVRKVCSTVPASDRVGFATVAPPPEPREATCECVENKKGRLNGRLSGEGRVRLSSLSDSGVRQSAKTASVPAHPALKLCTDPVLRSCILNLVGMLMMVGIMVVAFPFLLMLGWPHGVRYGSVTRPARVETR